MHIALNLLFKLLCVLCVPGAWGNPKVSPWNWNYRPIPMWAPIWGLGIGPCCLARAHCVALAVHLPVWGPELKVCSILLAYYYCIIINPEGGTWCAFITDVSNGDEMGWTEGDGYTKNPSVVESVFVTSSSVWNGSMVPFHSSEVLRSSHGWVTLLAGLHLHCKLCVYFQVSGTSF